VRGRAVGRIVLGLCVCVAPLAARAADDPSLYLGLDASSAPALAPGAPTGSTPHEDSATASEGETVTFGPFATAPVSSSSRLATGPVEFSVYLATGASGMSGCAEIAIALRKIRPSGPPVAIAARGLTTTLVPKSSLVDPIGMTTTATADKAARTLVAGDRLELTMQVTNRCTDGAHTVRLLYGAGTRPSRVGFTDVCPGVDDPDQTDTDDDGIGDACDVCPAQAGVDQTDRDGDGVGDACDDCPTVADPEQSDADADGTGSACDACPDAAGPPGEAAGCPCVLATCDDGDPCRADSCSEDAGCAHDPLPELAFVECRLDFLRDLIRTSTDLDAKLKEPTSTVRRALKQVGRGLFRLERARRARSYPRRAADLARRFQVFVARVLDAKREGRLSPALHDRLAILAGEAIDAIPER
jgi:hypothetical protein